MIEADVLKILCCPETRQPLALADSATMARLNERITARSVKNRGGKAVTEPCEGGLVRQDGQVVYPIRQGIPILIIAESLAI
jgi:uncharacterized protein YbaR (Trm112 family)